MFVKKPACVDFIAKSFGFLLALFYGWIVAIHTLFAIIKYGKSYFKVNSRDDPPIILTKSIYGDHHNVKLGDVNIHYVAKGKIENPLVLLIHGFPDFWFSWRHQISQLSQNYYVVAMDLRGYGESEKLPDLKSYVNKELVQDINALIDHFGKPNAVLIGHDWGGIFASELAAEYPSKVSHLVIINAPYKGAYLEALKSNLGQFFKSWYVFFFQLKYLPELTMIARDLASLEQVYKNPKTKQSIITQDELEAYKYTFSRPGAFTSAINLYRAQRFNEVDIFGTNIKKIKPPIMVIWGESDPYLSVECATKLTKFADNVKFEFLDAGHFPHIEKPKEVTKIIRRFIT